MDILRRLAHRLGFRDEWTLVVLGAAVGTLTSLGAVGFALTLHAAEHLASRVQERSSVWLLPLIPMGGALVTGVLVHVLARDARGHGVPQVLEALARRHGVIPARVGIVKVIASIATVGSGGSAGAEGPIVQIGATLGSVFGRVVRVSRAHHPTLVGCGAAAGIASVFNAPIAGVFFVLEVLLRDFSLRTFTPIVVASVFSTAMTQVLLGRNEAIFAVNLGDYTFSIAELPGYTVLGLLCAAAAVGFARALHAGEGLFERSRVHPIMRPVLGALLLGLLGITWAMLVRDTPAGARTPAFFGNGYGTIRWVIEPGSYAMTGGAGAEHISGMLNAGGGLGLPMTLAAVVLLTLFKVAGTACTLGSGGSGGGFAPSLFIGATAGASFGLALDAWGLMPQNASPASYALVGMAGVVAGATFAPLTAILLAFELSREPLVLLPVMLACIVAPVGARLWMRESIYTDRLRRAGVLLSAGRDLTVMRRVHVGDCDLAPLPPEPIYPSDPLAKLVAMHAMRRVPDFPVVEQQSGRYIGMVTGADIRTALIDREAIPLLLVAEVMRADLPTVSREESLDTVMDKFTRTDAASLAVVEGAPGSAGRSLPPVALLTRHALMARYHRALEEH